MYLTYELIVHPVTIMKIPSNKEQVFKKLAEEYTKTKIDK